jgi:hypothetical protein
MGPLQTSLLGAFLTTSSLWPVAAAPPPPPRLPGGCLQAIVVSALGWESPSAILQRWEREEPDAPWLPFGPPWPVALGKRGLAWGRGLHELPDGFLSKTEGDGKSPAGLFWLGPAFGSAEAAPRGLRMPWRQGTESDFFVDDPTSPDYNRWVRLAPGEPASWKSAERMRREDSLYAFGLVVQHNMHPVVPGAGSAIFLHVWRGPDSATAGCTAMARTDLLTLLSWLDPAKAPVLVQAPVDDWPKLRLSLEPPNP